MFLKELDLGQEVKCICEPCFGTGIYKDFSSEDGLGLVCQDCNGKGYYTLKLDEKMQLVQDEKEGVVYKVDNGLIVGVVRLFDKLQKRYDVKYVMYRTGRDFSYEYLFQHGASEINVIRYEEFMEGKFPLPMMQYTCPRQLSQIYGAVEFDNNCGVEDSSDFRYCKKFGSRECWEKFYGEAKTIEEKQNVLRRVK